MFKARGLRDKAFIGRDRMASRTFIHYQTMLHSEHGELEVTVPSFKAIALSRENVPGANANLRNTKKAPKIQNERKTPQLGRAKRAFTGL